MSYIFLLVMLFYVQRAKSHCREHVFCKRVTEQSGMFLLWFQSVGYVGYDDRIFFLPDASRMTELDTTGKQMSVEALPLSPVGGVVKDLLEAN